MGRGMSQRRRESNFIRAKQAKSGSLPLGPPPEELVRKGSKKRKRGRDESFPDAPRSFQKMMKMTEASQRRKNSKQQNNMQSVPASSSLPANVSAKDPISSYMGSPSALSKSMPEVSQTDQTKAPKQQTAEALFVKKPMKERKKQYLKERKLRKKGKSVLDDDEEAERLAEERETRIMTDSNRPTFGEQAKQPLKVNLKRKHWKDTAGEKPKNRLKQVFERQMADAQQRNSKPALSTPSQEYLINAYRGLKNAKDGQNASATRKSLAALVERNREMELARPD